MIPFAALACLLDTAEGQLEASVEGLSVLGFTCRLPRHAEAPVSRVTLRYHAFAGDIETTAAAFTRTCEEETADWRIWRFEIDSPDFAVFARRFIQDADAYTALKLAGDDALLAETLTGYPAKAEQAFPAHFTAQRARLFAECTPDARWVQAWAQVSEIAVALSSPPAWEAFLRLTPEVFFRRYWLTHDLAAHPAAQCSISGVVIGNPYCPLLTPDAETFLALLDKASNAGLRPALALPPVPEHHLDRILALLDAVTPWAEKHTPLEVIAQDWGLADELAARPAFTVTLGTLLNKRRKDVRLPYMQGFGRRGALLAQNAVHAPFYRGALAAQGISRVVCEACGQDTVPAPMPATLTLPFYQMNTAARCTLRALCEHGDRGWQTPDAACPHWCSTHAVLYPEALGMVGRWNTLFGFDGRSLADGAYLAGLLTGVDRIIVELL